MIEEEKIDYCNCGMTFRTVEGYRQHMLNGEHDRAMEKQRYGF